MAFRVWGVGSGGCFMECTSHRDRFSRGDARNTCFARREILFQIGGMEKVRRRTTPKPLQQTPKP